MGTLHEDYWMSEGAGTTRRQRAGGPYRWFLPTRLSDLSLSFDSDVVLDVARAERDLLRCSGFGTRNMEGIARLLLRSESVASSHMEGLAIGSNRLLRAELQKVDLENIRYDSRATAILGNIHAMERATKEAASCETITVGVLQDIHWALCEGTDIEAWGGVVRQKQNWVGGGNSNPFSAEYIPPAPQEVPGLLEDLVCYMNRTDVSPVVQAALCHAQFESIHPFADGNGRTGRALIHVCLIRRGLVGHAVPPISLALATEKDDYVDALRGVQHCLNEEEESRAYNDWVSCFCGAVSRACSDMEEIANDMETMRRGWIGRLGKVRSNSSLDLLLDEIQAVPIFTAETMAKAICRTEVAVGQAIDRLLEASIIRQSNKGKRRRIFETPDVMEMFNLVERKLASPSRDTKAEPPVRPVPERYGH